MAPSPPEKFSSVTIPAMPLLSAVATTAYCVLSVRSGICRGSMWNVWPKSLKISTWVKTSEPSENRYQRRVALSEPVDWMFTGVVQPFGPPSVRVTFGKYKVLG